ncbi:MAG: class I SAM-dependent methyltransferase [Chitinophagales bacterium]|nr:class I SAM-dependent methyltransferase [Chitinophagales bacterium]MDW8393516.1 class I SAM-dependent methyltransferase [Chitinophagales bacterium]
MFSFHQDKEAYFRMQYEHAKHYVLPFMETVKPVKAGQQVLEVGCGEGGVLQAFLERGLRGTGVELSSDRSALARRFLQPYEAAGQAEILTANLYDESLTRPLAGRFDFVVLKDVIEHLPDQRIALKRLATFLAPGGLLYFGFPPWQMPFGGHQQICRSRLLSHLPYIHLLPSGLYRLVLRMAGESAATIENLMEVKATGISLERFERCVQDADLHCMARRLYLINPIYAYKFGLQPREQFSWLSRIPWLRNFFTTAAFYLVGAHRTPTGHQL